MKKIIVMLIAIIVFASGISYAETADEYFDSAMSYVDKYRASNDRDVGKRMIEEAIKALNKVIELDPNYNNIYIHRADCYNRIGKYDKAIEDLNKAIEIQPDNFLAFYFRAKVYYESKQYALALSDYQLVCDKGNNIEEARKRGACDLAKYTQEKMAQEERDIARENYFECAGIEPQKSTKSDIESNKLQVYSTKRSKDTEVKTYVSESGRKKLKITYSLDGVVQDYECFEGKED